MLIITHYFTLKSMLKSYHISHLYHIRNETTLSVCCILLHYYNYSIFDIITWLVDICTRFYCLQSAISECNMKLVECKYEIFFAKEKTVKHRKYRPKCNKLVITWVFRAICYIFFSILYIALALRARAI